MSDPTVAVIGASNDRRKYGNKAVRAYVESGYTVFPVNPKEALTREQAVSAYTVGSAFAEFQEKQKGQLAVGMLADLAVLSADLFSVPVAELESLRSVLTMLGGKIVHDAGAIH